MDDEFEILAAKVLSGDATEDEETRLRELLAKDGRLEAEFDELRATWGAIKEFGLLAERVEPTATGGRASEPPPERLKQWRAALERKLQRVFEPTLVQADKQTAESDSPSWKRRIVFLAPLALAAVCIAAAVVAFLYVRRGGSREPVWPPVAYVVPNKGGVEIRRNGRSFPAGSPAPLREGDEITLLAGSSAAVITPTGTVLLEGPQTWTSGRLLDAPAQPRAETREPVQSLRRALFEPSTQLMGLITTRRGSEAIQVYSPVGFTAWLTPVILWKSEPGKTYEVSITDELAPATATLPPRGELADSFSRSGVVSPLEFTNAWPKRSLTRDGLYRLRISELGKPFSAGEVVFRTLPEADKEVRGFRSEEMAPGATNASALIAAYQMLTASPPRLGDALAILLTLPAELGDSELALRLKLFALGQLGYANDFEATLIQIKAANAN